MWAKSKREIFEEYFSPNIRLVSVLSRCWRKTYPWQFQLMTVKTKLTVIGESIKTAHLSAFSFSGELTCSWEKPTVLGIIPCSEALHSQLIYDSWVGLECLWSQNNQVLGPNAESLNFYLYFFLGSHTSTTLMELPYAIVICVGCNCNSVPFLLWLPPHAKNFSVVMGKLQSSG